MGAEAKQKDKMSGVNYTMAYDSTNLLTVNIVYDNENETAYVTIPELSDAYLYGTSEEIESWANDNVGNPMDSFSTINPSMDGGTDLFEDSSYSAAGGLDLTATSASSTPDLSALEDVDFGALFEDLATYVDTVKENAPDPTDADDFTVTQGNEKITLTTKRYVITEDDVKKVAQAVADKGKADSTLNDFFTQMGMSSDDINGFWDSLTDEATANSASDETLTLDVYYNGDEVQGLKATPSDEDEQIYFVIASDEEKMIVDCDTKMDGGNITGGGLVTMKDDVLNGSISLTSTGSQDMEFTVTFDDLTATDDTVTGKMTYSGKADDQDFNISYDFDCKGNDSSVTITGNVAGEDIGSINMTTTQTDASDIAVPSGTGYKLSDEQQLQSYIESCDVESWMNTVKGAVGDELYGQLFGTMAGSSAAYGGDDIGGDDFGGNDFSGFTTDTDGVGA